MNRSSEYLISKNVGLVYYLAQRFKTNYHDRQDLIQAGMMGLLNAINRFDINYQNSFSSFAVPYILGKMKQELAKLKYGPLPVGYHRNLKFIKENDHLSIHSLAQALNTTTSTILAIINHYERVVLLSSDQIDQQVSIIENREPLLLLDPDEQQLYLLRFRRQLSQQQIAALLKLNQSTVSRQIKKLVEKIKS